MKHVSNLLFAAAGLVILHTVFSCLLYSPQQNTLGIHAFYDSLGTATTVSDMAVDRISVRVEISEAELEEITLRASILSAEKNIRPRSKPAGRRLFGVAPADTLLSMSALRTGQDTK